MASINLVHVPYRGTAPALTGLLSGHGQVAFANIPGSIDHINAGDGRTVRRSAVPSPRRVDARPYAPSIGQPVTGSEVSIWSRIAAPRRTPPAIVENLTQAATAVLADRKLPSRVAEFPGAPTPMTPAE